MTAPPTPAVPTLQVFINSDYNAWTRYRSPVLDAFRCLDGARLEYKDLGNKFRYQLLSPAV